jgi:geranylgeranyl diphosphate synthase, type II
MTSDVLSPTFQEWLAAERAACDAWIADHLREVTAGAHPSSRVLEAVAYSLGQPGKRLRPILVRAACAASGGALAAARPAALAVECIHTFSLIHDDLPAMDDDDLRRGQPTSHKVFGEALAILAGDWLVTHAFALLAQSETSPEINRALVETLSHGSLGMVEGQAADIAGEGQPADRERVEFIHAHKTAMLLEAACRMGALSAAADETVITAVQRYGRHLGLAFQIVDDLLDVTRSTAELGKRAGKDADVAKQTYPAVFGVDESWRRARQEIDAAVASLPVLGPAGGRLRELAEFVFTRHN